MQLFQTVQTSDLVSRHSHTTCSSHTEFLMDPRLQILSTLRNSDHAVSYTDRSLPSIPCLANSHFSFEPPIKCHDPQGLPDDPLQSGYHHTVLTIFMTHSKTMVSFLCLSIYLLSSPFKNILHEGRNYICLAQHCILGARTVLFIAEISDIICGLGDWLSAGWSAGLHDLPWLIR